MRGRNINGRFIDNKTFLAWLFLDLIIVISLVGLINFETPEREIISPLASDYKYEAPKPSHSTENEKRDTTSAVIDKYFKRKGSPLSGLGTVFYDLADKYGYHVYLLPAISGCESSFAKRACGFNPFGWGRCKIGFDSWREAVETVGRKLGTLPVYSEWRKDKGNIAELALVYNPDTPRSWKTCVYGFMAEIKNVEIAND